MNSIMGPLGAGVSLTPLMIISYHVSRSLKGGTEVSLYLSCTYLCYLDCRLFPVDTGGLLWELCLGPGIRRDSSHPDQDYFVEPVLHCGGKEGEK